MLRAQVPWFVTLAVACGPGDRPDRAADAGGGGGAADAAPGFIDAGELFFDADVPTCAEATYTAEQSPAALLVVLDRSASMAASNKWTFAAQAIVTALDKDVFDSMHVGLYAAPTGTVTGPACVFNLPVACQVPPFPQIDVTLAGPMKSTAASSGVRRDIKDWLAGNAPSGGLFEPDGSPLYDAIVAASSALAAWPSDGKRILLIVSDGSISCAQFSNRAGFADCNDCDHDWEHPQNIIDLLAQLRTDATTPILSFVVGVPGADTYDASACMYPPYHMRLALSAMAWAGAPELAPGTCTGQTFTPGGADPSESCHFDMTTPGSFTAQKLADVITKVRGEVLGCVFEMPEPQMGTIDPNEVNVGYTVDGTDHDIGRRADSQNPCNAAPGCWDYTMDGDIELIGAACEAVKGWRQRRGHHRGRVHDRGRGVSRSRDLGVSPRGCSMPPSSARSSSSWRWCSRTRCSPAPRSPS